MSSPCNFQFACYFYLVGVEVVISDHDNRDVTKSGGGGGFNVIHLGVKVLLWNPLVTSLLARNRGLNYKQYSRKQPVNLELGNMSSIMFQFSLKLQWRSYLFIYEMNYSGIKTMENFI